jgi:uncharacterized protein (DUF169 family)
MTSTLSYAAMQDTLMAELRLMHYPIAVKYFFEQAALDEFEVNAEQVFSPAKPISFCQWEIAPRMKGQTVLAKKSTWAAAMPPMCWAGVRSMPRR